VEAQQHSLLHLQPQRDECAGDAVDAFGEFGVGIRRVVVVTRNLTARPVRRLRSIKSAAAL
jgi:hypothetical protein